MSPHPRTNATANSCVVAKGKRSALTVLAEEDRRSRGPSGASGSTRHQTHIRGTWVASASARRHTALGAWHGGQRCCMVVSAADNARTQRTRTAHSTPRHATRTQPHSHTARLTRPFRGSGDRRRSQVRTGHACWCAPPPVWAALRRLSCRQLGIGRPAPAAGAALRRFSVAIVQWRRRHARHRTVALVLRRGSTTQARSCFRPEVLGVQRAVVSMGG
jgi:hypothetical protein